jgi:thiol:disulfide interchange protein DsbD
MLLWGSLLIGSAIYMGALEPIAGAAAGWRKLWKAMGLVLLVYGATMLIGAAAGGKDTLQPLRGVLFAGDAGAHRELTFQTIKTVADLDREITSAKADGRSVMLDFYADWCVSCKEMERYTFSDDQVVQALASTTLLQADVTANDEADRALLQRFDIIGPPAILFFGNDGRERRGYRVVGYMPAERFAPHARDATL